MKLFAIRDQVNNPGTDLGYLIYYPKKKQFFIELSENVPAEDLPILLSQMKRDRTGRKRGSRKTMMKRVSWKTGRPGKRLNLQHLFLSIFN